MSTSACQDVQEFTSQVLCAALQATEEINAHIDGMIDDLESMRHAVVLEVHPATHTIVSRADSRARRRERSQFLHDAARVMTATRRLVRDGTLMKLIAQKAHIEAECVRQRKAAGQRFEPPEFAADMLAKRRFLNQLGELRKCVRALRCNGDRLSLDERIIRSFNAHAESSCQTEPSRSEFGSQAVDAETLPSEYGPIFPSRMCVCVC
jgi:hypothetical protein